MTNGGSKIDFKITTSGKAATLGVNDPSSNLANPNTVYGVR
jgi:hypothetical protein